MHIPDGFLDTPVIISTYLASAGGLAFSWQKVKKQFDQQTVPQMAVLAAFVFVAQMINIPITGGTSGHLLGGFLAALFLGPYAAVFIMALILFVQMLIFQDGGLTALGANILNMGIIGVGSGYLVYSLLENVNGLFAKSHLFRSGIIFLAAWISVVAGAVFCGVELGLSGLADVKITTGLMASVHALIGLIEGIMTVFIFEAVQMIRPDLIYSVKKRETR